MYQKLFCFSHDLKKGDKKPVVDIIPSSVLIIIIIQTEVLTLVSKFSLQDINEKVRNS